MPLLRCMGAPADYVDTGDMFALSTFGERDFYFMTPLPSMKPDSKPPYNRISNATREVVGAPRLCHLQ